MSGTERARREEKREEKEEGGKKRRARPGPAARPRSGRPGRHDMVS
jgi:hypothetical protein